jgi:hypothetical protein
LLSVAKGLRIAAIAMRAHSVARRWLLMTLILCGVSLAGGGLGHAAPVDAGRGSGIALIPIEVSGLNVPQEALETAVMKGLAVAGRPMVKPEDTVARAAEAKTDVACQSAQCWSRLGSLTHAGYLVSGSAAREGDSFRVRFRLVSAADGSTVASEDNQCEVADCSVAELARRSARELVRQTLGRAGEVHAGEPSSAVPIAAPAPAPVRLEPDSGPPPPPPSQHRWVWPVLAGVSAVAIAGGAWLIVADGEKAPFIDKQIDHGTVWGLVAIGAGVVVGGLSAYHILGDSEHGASVAVGIAPNGLWAAGRF